MASFQQATREQYQTAFGDLGAMSAFEKRTQEGFFQLKDGTLFTVNLQNRTARVLIDSTGKAQPRDFSGSAAESYISAARNAKFVSAGEAKRMQEDAGRKYKTAAVRVNDKLLYKTWKAPKVDAVVEVTPSWLKVTYSKDRTVDGVTYKAGKPVNIKNNDPTYRKWADELNAAFKDGKLVLARRATSADDAELRRTAKAKLPGKLLGQTWNDGTYTYKVGKDGSVTVKNKTWTPGKGDYDTVAKQLNIMDSEKRLKSGALKTSAVLDEAGVKDMKDDLVRTEEGDKVSEAEESAPETAVASSSSSSADEKVEIREGKGAGGGMTDSPYFWPAVGVGALALGLGGYFLLRKKG